MNKSDIVNIVMACIVSAGSTAVIIVGVIKFTTVQIAESLQKKYQLKLDKELETYRTSLGKKGYVSKVRFDKEFEIFGELNKAFIEMVESIDELFPVGLVMKKYETAEEQNISLSEQCNYATLKMRAARDILYKNAAFIKKSHYERFENLMEKCKKQVQYFEIEHFRANWSIPQDVDPYLNTKVIDKEWSQLVDDIRSYLASLEVL